MVKCCCLFPHQNCKQVLVQALETTLLPFCIFMLKKLVLCHERCPLRSRSETFALSEGERENWLYRISLACSVKGLQNMPCSLDLWKDRNMTEIISWLALLLSGVLSKIFTVYLLRIWLASLASIIFRKGNNLWTITVFLSELFIWKIPPFFVMPLPSHIAQMNLDLHSLHVHSRIRQGKNLSHLISNLHWASEFSITVMQSKVLIVCFWKKKRLLNIYREINFYLVRVCSLWGWGK